MGGNTNRFVRRHMGFLLSYAEEYLFLAFVASLITIFAFKIGPVEMHSRMLTTHGAEHYLYVALFYSLFLYPLLFMISIIAEKLGLYTAGDYNLETVPYLMFFNVWNDLIFPIYIIINRDKAPIATVIDLIIWVLEVLLLAIGINVLIA